MKRINPKLRLARTDGVGESAFTRLELLSVIVTLVLVAGVVIPAFAQSKPRSERAVCFNNLRLIGQAALLFNAENDQKDPWWSVSGNHPSGLGNNAWFQFMLLSNGLSNPKVLACPSDSLARPAKEYSLSSDGGLFNPNFRNNSISYFLGLDSSVLTPGSVFAGDRDMNYDRLNDRCSSGIFPCATLIIGRRSQSVWRGELHGAFGNLLLHDGRVELTSNQTVNRWFSSDVPDVDSFHILTPRP